MTIPGTSYVAEATRGQRLMDQGQLDEALAVFSGLLETLGDEPGYPRAVVLGRLAHCLHSKGEDAAALVRCREALEVAGRLAPSDGVRRLRGTVRSQSGDVLRAMGRMAEARKSYEAALALAEDGGDRSAERIELERLASLAGAQGDRAAARQWWRRLIALDRDAGDLVQLGRHWAALARLELAAHEAGSIEAGSDEARGRAEAEWRAADELARRAPQVLEAARLVGRAPTRARAVILERLARCYAMAGRPDLAAAQLEQAGAVMTQVERSAGTRAPAGAAGGPSADRIPGGRVEDELVTEFGFDNDLLVDTPSRRHTAPLAATGELPADARPVLALGARTWVDDEGRLRLALLPEAPKVVLEPGCTILERTRREIVLPADALAWRVLGALDGRTTVERLLSGLPDTDRPAAARLLAALADAGALDLTGRAIGRFLHAATRKGTLPAGGLHDAEVLALATEGARPPSATAERLPVADEVPPELTALHRLTRARRSRRDYASRPITRGELDALLATACGVTGTLRWGERELPLRAYPSSGALYAVEIYPVALRVEQLPPAVYRYRPDERALERVAPLDGGAVVRTALPTERAMVAGAAALVCLTGRFRRHERKYGQGGHRMLVAEAGHISQSLVLAATALGLAARPFGGFFDTLLNADLGLDPAEEEFLLAVVVGHAGED
jgi:SagB-type dehydrogenase family enzyme